MLLSKIRTVATLPPTALSILKLPDLRCQMYRLEVVKGHRETPEEPERLPLSSHRGREWYWA